MACSISWLQLCSYTPNPAQSSLVQRPRLFWEVSSIEFNVCINCHHATYTKQIFLNYAFSGSSSKHLFFSTLFSCLELETSTSYFKIAFALNQFANKSFCNFICVDTKCRYLALRTGCMCVVCYFTFWQLWLFYCSPNGELLDRWRHDSVCTGPIDAFSRLPLLRCGWVLCPMPVIPTVWESETRGSEVSEQLGQLTRSLPALEIQLLAEPLSIMCEVCGSVSCSTINQ